MACQATTHSWTFAGLVGAFVNLTIAYLLLCASAVVFFASKFLGFLGLSLPCSCNALQTLLIDSHKQSVSSVMVSVKRSFPFNSIYQEDYSLNLRLISDGNQQTVGVVQIEEDAASSSLASHRRKSPDSIGNGSFTPRKLAIGLRCNELGNHVPESGEFSPDSSYISSSVEMGSGWDQSPCIGNVSSSMEMGSGWDQSPGIVKGGSIHDFGIVKGGSIHDFDSDRGEDFDAINRDKEVHDKRRMLEEKSDCSCEEEEEQEMIKHIEEKDAIRILERALEDERNARASLYVELEKERIAASTAADEAMAMILRLQEEKALREMEARHYRRMVEEKSAYEEDEMTILKEIIVAREKEKHFLEKEIEAYREAASTEIDEEDS